MPDISPDELYSSLEEFLMRLLSLAETDGIDTLVDMDVSFSQARMVFYLACAQDAAPIHELADALRVSVATAGRNVDRLVKLGLVERRESRDDRRVKLVSLSPAGQEVAYQQLAVKRAAVLTFVTRLGAEHRACLYEALLPILAGTSLRPIHHPTPQESSV